MPVWNTQQGEYHNQLPEPCRECSASEPVSCPCSQKKKRSQNHPRQTLTAVTAHNFYVQTIPAWSATASLSRTFGLKSNQNKTVHKTKLASENLQNHKHSDEIQCDIKLPFSEGNNHKKRKTSISLGFQWESEHHVELRLWPAEFRCYTKFPDGCNITNITSAATHVEAYLFPQKAPVCDFILVLLEQRRLLHRYLHTYTC